mmetsp:Transcript_19201/g.41273  ORF Transcript_19201/g.41273 Transcript_19201/m.41273 type:complete len:90 (-) Transcript_19201:54-323(-)
MESRTRPWHITLAYPRGKGKMPTAIKEQARDAVCEAFSHAYGESPFVFYPAKLCLSPDVTRFIPWDGTIPQEDGVEDAALAESMRFDLT